jgi:hypothetical protein
MLTTTGIYCPGLTIDLRSFPPFTEYARDLLALRIFVELLTQILTAPHHTEWNGTLRGRRTPILAITAPIAVAFNVGVVDVVQPVEGRCWRDSERSGGVGAG